MHSPKNVIHSVTVYEFIDDNGDLGLAVLPEGNPSMMQMVALLEMGKLEIAHNRTLKTIRGSI
ncbi:hypothetical protein HMPREF2736_00215 [Corynebacterium sp. HMSC036E10]|uniref:hypothetical protein n=1 Tax=Corynebacterium coyleae TaxID=53374 RepID=UPI0008A9A3BF|nr:hypothetical protein [Corynebacterium coyleae]OHO77689.1 hypothetical protein HMPREF2736_00215 [Corynebacterium sp. HMSC036E10]